MPWWNLFDRLEIPYLERELIHEQGSVYIADFDHHQDGIFDVGLVHSYRVPQQ